MPTHDFLSENHDFPSASHDFPSDNIGEELFLEQVRAYYRDMKAVADNASDGHVIRFAETFAVTQGHYT